MLKLIISEDFSDSPGGRYIDEGEFSGEEFREKFLSKKFIEAKNSGEKLLVDLDGTFGYATSFLDEAFGILSKDNGYEDVLSIIEFKSNDQPSLIEDIKTYMKDHE